MVHEQPNYGHNHVREFNLIQKGNYYLLVGLVKPVSVTLVRVESEPYQDEKGFLWVDTIEIRKLGSQPWFHPHKFSLRDVGIIPVSENPEKGIALWNNARCLLITNQQELPKERSNLDLLEPTDKKMLLQAAR